MTKPTSSSVFSSPSCTRLVSIVAHVDHGKTSLADSLVEYNGIISERLAGTMRFLDSLEEEQRRGITIKSSAIALKHSYIPPPSAANSDKVNTETDMVIHILDSPGHVDFAVEVTAALQVCDGALLLVDVIEGMCARTHSILREAFSMSLTPILVLNKIDRLCTELKLSPNEAYVRIRHVIESVNAATSNIIRSSLADCVEHNPIDMQETQEQSSSYHQEKELVWTFEPSKGNVVFASALFGWGFTVPSLARALFKGKLIPNIKPPVLKQYLFGDYKYSSETGKVTKWKHQPSSALVTSTSTSNEDCLTMFAEFALGPIWTIYEGINTAAISVGMLTSEDYHTTCVTQPHNTRPTSESIKILATSPGMNLVMESLLVASTAPTNLSAIVPQSVEQMRLLLNKVGASSEVNVLRGILRRFRPLSNAILDAICEHCPSPVQASSLLRTSMLSLITPSLEETENSASAHSIQEFHNIQESVRQCQIPDSILTGDTTTVTTVAHVCKFIATDSASIQDADLRNSLLDCSKAESGTQNKSVMLGIARVLSGTLRSLDVEYYALGPKHEFMKTDQRRRLRLYLIMGATFLRVKEVPAGHICAVYGLEDLQLKTLTLCNHPCAMPLVPFSPGLRPLVKVNVEAISVSDTDILERGLQKLSLADASIEATITAKGEHILACLGEIHLEQSLLDLRRLYCERNIELRISDPIVEFGECTEWFENEIGDHEQFYDDLSPPLRQVTIPPYSYEDGLAYAKRGRCRAILSGRGAAIHIRVIPLATSVYNFLKTKQVQEETINDVTKIWKALKLHPFEHASPTDMLEKFYSLVTSFDDQYGNILMEGNGIINGTCIRGIESNRGEVSLPLSNVDSTDDNNPIDRNKVSSPNHGSQVIQQCIRAAGNLELVADLSVDLFAQSIWASHMRGSTVAGFRSACRAGPLCEEPLRGLLVVIEGVEIAVDNTGDAYEVSKMISGGLVVTAMRTGIRSAFLTRPVRLSEQHFRLTLHSSLSGLGPLYAILSKRRGKVISDTMVDGTDLISIVATVPQAESFRLAPELLEKSSGDVTAPELVFSHWEVLPEDPFWIPTSLEEREDYGEIVSNGDRSTGMSSVALKYIRSVRQRKGLIVDSSKIVVAAEKQRTLAKKK